MQLYYLSASFTNRKQETKLLILEAEEAQNKKEKDVKEPVESWEVKILRIKNFHTSGRLAC